MKQVLVVHQCRPPGTFHDRQRGHMYAPLFRDAGYEVRFVGRHPLPPFQDPRGTLQVALSRMLLVKAWGRLRDRFITNVSDIRVRRLARQANVVLLVKVDSPRLVLQLSGGKARVVYDLVDSVWRTAGGAPRTDMLESLRHVDALTVATPSARAMAETFGPPVHVWPTASYIEAFDARRSSLPRDPDRVVVGWLGSHSTASNLYLALEALERILDKHPNVHIRLVGLPSSHEILARLGNPRVSSVGMYTAEEMVDEVLRMDIGIDPCYDLREGSVHGVTKDLVYMAGGAAVVASPVHDRITLFANGATGILARTSDDWEEALTRFVVDAALRRRIGEAGIMKARAEYSLQACFEGVRPCLEGSR